MPGEQQNNASVVLRAILLLINYDRDGVAFW